MSDQGAHVALEYAKAGTLLHGLDHDAEDIVDDIRGSRVRDGECVDVFTVFERIPSAGGRGELAFDVVDGGGGFDAESPNHLAQIVGRLGASDVQGVSLTLDDYEALVGALGYELHLHPELVKRVAV